MPTPQSITSEIQKLAPSAIIELFQVNASNQGLATPLYFHAGTNGLRQPIVFQGITYTPYPVEVTGFDYNGRGTLPRPTMRVSNVFSTITALMLQYNDLIGAQVTRIRTLARYLDGQPTADSSAEFPREIYVVDRKSSENREIVEFELASALDLAGVELPRRQIIQNSCPWVYRGAECGYIGNAYYDTNDQAVGSLSQDVCGKRLSSCKVRFNRVVRAGTVTVGSNQLVMDAPFAASTGDPVTGFGIPAGTTVVSYSGSNITLSANATATTSTTKTGTLQSSLTQIVLTNTTGLAVGMTVTGPAIPSGTVIESISGNTITLGQPADLWQLVTVATTKSGQIQSQQGFVFTNTATGNGILTSSTSGVSVGMYVTGPTVPQSARAKVTGISGSGFINVISISYVAAAASSNGTYTFYTLPAQTSKTYTFTAGSRNYVFRSDQELPFGGFPSAGLIRA